MIMVDSSVWVDHLRNGDTRLNELLLSKQVLTHAFIIGELALGHMQQRQEILLYLKNLPQALSASDEEVLSFIEDHSMHGLGIGYVDAHLLASARLTHASLWTKDKALHKAASALNLTDRLQ